MILSVLQSAWSTGFNNGLVLFGLVSVFAADLAMGHVPERWTRWLEMSLAWIKAPMRWWWLTQQWIAQKFFSPGTDRVSMGGLLSIVLPTVLLTGFFALLLGSGNAVLAAWFSDLTRWINHWLEQWAVTVPRFSFWVFWSTVILVSLRPSLGRPARWLWWARLQPRVEPEAVALSQWRSAILLLALNGLFALSNGLDVVYLWAKCQLPAGTSPSAYVHDGVESLIAAVLVSALVLGWIFQAAPRVTRHPGLRVLGLLWILQNIVLIFSVGKRLALYVETYQFTTARVYVGFFLLLVMAGIVLLALQIAQEKSLGWLIGRNLIAVCMLFFITQFLDVDGWVAAKNVELWKRDQSRELDLGYLKRLGPSAWPAMRKLKGTSLEIKVNESLEISQMSYEKHQSIGPSWQGFVVWHWEELP
jgi:hypothetical protein